MGFVAVKVLAPGVLRLFLVGDGIAPFASLECIWIARLVSLFSIFIILGRVHIGDAVGAVNQLQGSKGDSGLPGIRNHPLQKPLIGCYDSDEIGESA